MVVSEAAPVIVTHGRPVVVAVAGPVVVAHGGSHLSVSSWRHVSTSGARARTSLIVAGSGVNPAMRDNSVTRCDCRAASLKQKPGCQAPYWAIRVNTAKFPIFFPHPGDHS